MARGGRSRSKKDTTDTATTQVDDRTTAVDQAAAASRAADAPEPASSVTDAVAAGTVTEIGTTQEFGAELAGQDLELSEEQQAEIIPTPDEDVDALFGLPSVEDLKNRRPDDTLLGTGGDPNAPSDDPRENLEAAQAFNPFGTKGSGAESGGGGGSGGNSSDTNTGGGGAGNADQTSSGSGGLGGDARDTGAFDLLQDPGAGGDPLSSFLGAVEGRLGRDLGPAPSEQTNDPVGGAPSVAEGEATSTVNTNAGIGVFTQTGAEGTTVTVVDVGNATRTTVLPDGSTYTTDSGGNVLDETPPLDEPLTGDAIHSALNNPDLVPALEKMVETTGGIGGQMAVSLIRSVDNIDRAVRGVVGGVKDPGGDDAPDDGRAPLPEELVNQLGSEVARVRALKPDTGDGVTDPTDSPVEVIDPSATLESQREFGRDLISQPDTTAQEDGGPANFNPGADSTGAGVITPSDDKDVVAGGTRNDDPFADAGTAAEPVTSSNDATDDSVSFLPSETEGPAIDDKPDLPDPITDPA